MGEAIGDCNWTEEVIRIAERVLIKREFID